MPIRMIGPWPVVPGHIPEDTVKSVAFKLTPQPCPCCHELVVAACRVGLSDDPTPDPPLRAGDIGVCLYCVGLAVFNENFFLRRASDDEIVAAVASADGLELSRIMRLAQGAVHIMARFKRRGRA